MEFTYTPEELDKIIKLYHQDCEVNRCIFPDLAGLKNKLDISDEEYEAMEKDEVYSKILRWARRRRESWLTILMLSFPISVKHMLQLLLI